MRRRQFLAILGAGSVGLGGCVAGTDSAAQSYDIGMRASAFDPQRFETTVGATVVWRNTNSRAHTVTAYENTLPDGAAYFASGGFGSETAARKMFWDRFGGSIPSRETYAHTFDVPGDYDYFCVPHERGGMVGRVTVTD